MQQTLFEWNAGRIISSSFHNTYVAGSLHPDRVMAEHDFIYMTCGEWEIFQNGEKYLMQSGDVLILTAGEHHYGRLPCSDGTRTVYLHVNRADDSFLPKAESAETGSRRIPLHAYIPCGNAPGVRSCFDAIAEVFSSQTSYRQERLSVLFQTLLLRLYDAQNSAFSQSGEFVSRVMRFIRENPQRFYTNRELAELFFVCPRTLTLRFQRGLGMTPYRYQMETKLQSAAAFLTEHPQAKLREAAENFGFYDEFHFSRTFRQKFGAAPRDYRDSHAGARPTGNRTSGADAEGPLK